MTINTHNLIVDFGKHNGERWTRVPISYLKWLMNEVGGEKAEIAKSELERRGTTIERNVELSGHAIHRASQITNEWKEEGLWSWLQRMSTEANNEDAVNDEIDY